MPVCRLCGASEAKQNVCGDFVFGGTDEHKFWRCADCDAVYLFPVPSEEDEARFYRQEFEKYMSTRVGDHRDWSNAEAHIRTNQDQVRRRLAFMEPYIKPGIDVLEVGCSSGFMLEGFKSKGMNAIGVEPSGEFLQFLQSNGHESYQYLEEVPADRKFDLIAHFFVFEHIRDPFSFMRETYDKLKLGGLIVAEIPCVNDPLTSLYDIPAFEKFYWSIAHHYYYSPDSIAYIMKQLGYEYELFPEQRYDLSNHIVWMTEGQPGGQGKLNHVFSEGLIETYKNDLKKTWLCDTMFLVVRKV